MKDSWISTSIILFFISIFLNTFVAPIGPLCHPNQRDLLLEFKNEFQTAPEHSCSLSSDDLCSAKHWEKEKDCCTWNGITCDPKSGEVIELNASCCFYGHFNSNSSLFRLQSLRSLNLAYNNFNSSLIPSQFSNLMELTKLNLSLSSFSGQIPTKFLQLTKLVFLDLSYNFLLSFEKSFFTKFSQNLTNLEELNLSMVNISSEIPPNISNLSSLKSLNLDDCSLLGTLPPDFFLIPTLQSITASSNQNLEGSLPEFHGNNSLVILDLSSTSLSGNIPDSISNLKYLAVLTLKSCKFSGKIPSSIGNFSYLTTLDLSQNHFSGTIPSSIGYLTNLTTLKLSKNGFSGLIPSSIGNLSQLTNLPLFSNNFSGQIPSSIGNLLHLTNIDLSYNHFSGQIPSSLGNLSSLVTLNLYINNFVGEIPASFGNLNQLTSLSVMGNKLSGNFPIKLLNLTELSELELSQNQFMGTLPPNMSSLSKLESFTAFDNSFTGTLPSSLFNIPNLTSIFLNDNQLNGPLEFGNISSPSKLQRLYIGNNNFRGPIPRSISRLVNLISLDLSNLNTETTVDFCSFSHFKSLKDLYLAHLNTTSVIDLKAVLSCLNSLAQLVLSGNYVSDANMSSASDPPLQSMISTLKFSGCSITEFPDFIKNQPNLVALDLSNNNIKDQVPAWLWGLPQLQFVDLSNNTAISFERSSDNYSSNPVPAANMSSIFDPPSPLTVLTLSACSITRVPEFIKRHQSITSLNLSNNKIKGQVPGWLWTLPNLMHLDLSNNLFISFEESMKPGEFSFPKTSMKFLFGSKNYFAGKIPSFICALSSLTTLDLSNNNFDGPIPRCMENLKNTLEVLNLHQNRLNGSLPATIFDSLRSLDVGHNQIVGKLPRSLIRFSALEVLNVESNGINDTFPFWLSSLQVLQVLVLRSNAFYGPIHKASFPKLRIIDISRNHFSGALPSDYFVNWSAMSSLGTNEDWSNGKYMVRELGYYHDSIVLINKGVEIEFVRILTIYTALDFSGNNLQGGIPRSIGLLKGLHALNLSNNALIGRIPSSMKNLIELESLDVSQNKLSGEIPQELGILSYLAYMNFSHNQLVGPVPGGTQFRRQPCSSFEDNLGLYGPSLDEVCADIHAAAPQQSETPEEEDEEVLSWLAAVIGFGPGVALGFTIGYILFLYKPEWFTQTFGRNKRITYNKRTR